MSTMKARENEMVIENTPKPFLVQQIGALAMAESEVPGSTFSDVCRNIFCYNKLDFAPFLQTMNKYLDIACRQTKARLPVYLTGKLSNRICESPRREDSLTHCSMKMVQQSTWIPLALIEACVFPQMRVHRAPQESLSSLRDTQCGPGEVKVNLKKHYFWVIIFLRFKKKGVQTSSIISL